ncbi:DUF1549 and DUF1553 domain-containing protein [Neorhodopirellula pilleata]|uniref:Bacterial Ig-like domain (Group 2) n=1 Tax=Neorhodopirellula pilleata TaxID=2714738 RepID=A0A5C6AS59_9BACT|nr:DUF1549 and DUF1553 domain-containing protein [Neorhodopirellula pilleata]TWU02099.1 hypothetical protein Pla100_18390 [Neorhodopirellula pilleata]
MFRTPWLDRWHSPQLILCCFGILCVWSVAKVHAVAPTSSSGSSPTEQTPVSFVNDIIPVLTKAGCNGGVCHAKAGGGQNGFQLSLFGYEPEEDYQHLVLEGRGRRLFPLRPEQSLLLMKACGDVPHGGGVRFDKDSDRYQTLLRWVRSGTPYRLDDDPDLVSLELQPAFGTIRQGDSLELRSIAVFSDGSRQDVTSTSLFESNQPAMITVTEDGTVTASDLPGRASVMVRYQDRIAVYNAAIPMGEGDVTCPEPNNFVDELVFANLRELNIPPSPVCDDATFLRRVSLDIAGRLPTEQETHEFLVSDSEDKRARSIDRLLQSASYADYFANKWTALLKNRRDDASDITSNFAFHAWVRDSLLAGSPYDQFVRELLAATGTILSNPPVAWYKRVKEPKEQIEDVAQLFLGVRLQCAQCHHHPFERWSQDDYYSLAAFFSRIGRKPTDTAGEDLIFHNRGIAESINMRTGKAVRPQALGDAVGDVAADEDPRLRLANWMASKENPFFAKALVNRYWKHFFGRGLIEPEDDIRDSNPPTNPELLAALEKHFVDSGFDMRSLIRVITTSKAYQLSSVPEAGNAVDQQNFSHFYPKRLQAEVMLDAIDQLAGTTTSFANLPIGTRAVALPDNSYNVASPFLRVFGRPEATSVCECERVQSGALSQSLHLMNASDIKSKLAAGDGRINRLIQDKSTPEAIVDHLYHIAFSREPSSDESSAAVAYLNESRVDKEGKPIAPAQALKDNVQDLSWALMNTKEFLFNH